MQDPVTLYFQDQCRLIPAVDVPGWLNAGWSKLPSDPKVEEKETVQPPPSDPKVEQEEAVQNSPSDRKVEEKPKRRAKANDESRTGDTIQQS